jgi:hypothetical protein
MYNGTIVCEHGSNDDKTTLGVQIKVRGFVGMDVVTFLGLAVHLKSAT